MNYLNLQCGLYHTWAPSDQWVCTDQSQRSGMGVQTSWNFRQTNWNFMVVYTLLKKHAFAVLKCQKNRPSDQSEMTQDQSWPQGAHVWITPVYFISILYYDLQNICGTFPNMHTPGALVIQMLPRKHLKKKSSVLVLDTRLWKYTVYFISRVHSCIRAWQNQYKSSCNIIYMSIQSSTWIDFSDTSFWWSSPNPQK